MTQPAYDDDQVTCTDSELVIKHYYFPSGTGKRIPYSRIRGVARLELTGVNALRRWRIWGSGDLVHWWNLDPRRPSKSVAFVLDLGGKVRPTITPSDPEAFVLVVAAKQDAH